MIEIKTRGKLIALIIKAKSKINRFVTKPNSPLQLGCLKFSKNQRISPHQHRTLSKTTHKNQEFIYVVSGQIQADFCYKGRTLATHTLNPDDCLLQLSGGHGFTFLKPTKIITVKQGPYSGRLKEKKLLRTV